MYRIAIAVNARADLKSLRAYDRQEIAERIDRDLVYEPLRRTRNRKPLRVKKGVTPFPFKPPLWELRIRDFRVYYDVDEQASVVNVRWIGRKLEHKTTEESLHEDADY